MTKGVVRGRARLGRAPHLDFVGADACYLVVNRDAAWPRHRPVPQVRCRELTSLSEGGQWTRQALWVEFNKELASVFENNLQLEMPEHAEARDPGCQLGGPAVRRKAQTIRQGAASDQDPLHLVHAHLVPTTVIQPGRQGRLVICHLLCHLQSSSVAQVLGDTSGPEAVAPDAGADIR